MTTSNKNFKVKNGLEVQGATATVNGQDVLTTGSSIDALNDVNTTGKGDGDVLVYNATSGQWEPAEGGTGGGGGPSFSTIAVPSGTNPVADTTSDTLTFSAGTGISITGDATSDTVTIASTVTTPNTFSTIAVPSGTNPVADSSSDTLSLTAGTGITITGDSSTDSIQIATTGLALSSHTHATSDITSGTLDIARIPTGTTSSTVAIGNDSRITGAIQSTEKGANNGVAPLGSDGKIASTYLPPVAITNTYVVGNEASMLALTAEVGDIAVRTDLNKSFVLRIDGASTLANWQELLTPTDAVLSVNGKTGAVSLTNTDVGAAATSHTHTVANITDLTATATELNYTDGVTSNIQTQLNGKAASSHTHVAGDIPNLENLNGTLDVASGGTGAGDAATARTNLGLAIGTDVQAYNATLAAVAGGTYTGDDSITTVGTIGTGTWQATDVGLAHGGTNASLTATNGGVVYSNASAMAISDAGTQDQVLKSNGAGAPTWQTLDLTYLPDAAFKKSVRVATTANITLSGTQTIDGIALVAGDRVLVKNQTAAAENGIYTVDASTWTRPADANLASEIGGAVVNVDSGTQGGQLWTTSFKTTDTLGTTAMVWGHIRDSSTDIPLSDGGTSASLTAVNGGVVYSTASAMAITAAGTAGQVLTSNGAGAPTWTTPSSGGVSQTNGTVTTASTSLGVVRNIYISTSNPSGGIDGDIWMVYT